MAATRSRRHKKSPGRLAQTFICQECDQKRFCVQVFNGKGRGVVAQTTFERGDFLLQYAGVLRGADEANRLEDDSSSGFRYFFQYKQKQLCIDATEEPVSGPTLGRLVNHGDRSEVNSKMKVVEVKNVPALCLFAIKDISVGQEILYDYGISDLPWKSKVPNNTGSTEQGITATITKSHLTSNEYCADLNNMTPVNAKKAGFSTPAAETHSTDHNKDTTPSYLDPDLAENSTHHDEDMIPIGEEQVCATTMAKSNTDEAENTSNPDEGMIPIGEEQVCATTMAKSNTDEAENTSNPDEDMIPIGEEQVCATTMAKSNTDEAENTSNPDEGMIPIGEEQVCATTMAKSNTDEAENTSNPDEDMIPISEEQVCATTMAKSNTDEAEHTSNPDEDMIPISEEQVCATTMAKSNTDEAENTSNHDEDITIGEEQVCATTVAKSNSADEEHSFDHNETASSDTEEECADRHAYLMLLDISNSLVDISNSGETSQATNHLQMENSKTQVGDHVVQSDCSSSDSDNVVQSDCSSSDSDSAVQSYCSSSDNEDDPPYSPPAYQTGYDSDSSEAFPFYPQEPSSHSSCSQNVVPVSTEASALSAALLEPVTSSVSSSSLDALQESPITDEVSDTVHSSEDMKVTSSTDPQAASAAGSCSYSKPYRLCIFCNTFKSKLAQHIATQHAGIERVSKALQLPKQERMKVFDSFRKEGILIKNKQQAKVPNPSYHRERTSKNKSPLVMCNICSGFYSKYYLRRHTNKCQGRSESSPTVLPVPLELLRYEQEYNTNFFQDILCRFRQDTVGKLCISDPWLMKVGKRLWEKQRSKVNKKTEVRKSVMTDMRRMATLYMDMMKAEKELGELPAKEGTISDVFKRANFSHLEMAINSCTSSETTEPNSVKAGLKLGLYYLLKSTAKIIKATYLIEDKDDLSTSVDKFVSVLELNSNFLFGDATYKINQQRQIKLRKPEALPCEDDVRHLRQHTIQRMEQITKDELEFWDTHRFVELRDLVVCRLTLFNARRGGEPCRLLLTEWDDAENNVWLDKLHLEALDSIDRALADDFKIAYQSGKGNKHLVPVLFPKDTIESVRKLRRVDVRSTAMVCSNNVFLFPTINGSENHVSGWHAVRSVCDKVNLTNKDTLTATKNRHRLSTMFALMDVPESERQYIYKHMGHSEETNQHIYQAPLAVKELTVVAKRLQTIDEDVIPSCSGTSKSCDASSKVNDVCMTETSGGNAEHTEDTSEDGCEKADVFKGGRGYCKWKKEETLVVRNYFHKYFLGTEEKTLPGRKEILAFLEETKLKKEWKTVHTKMMNEVRKAKSTAVQQEKKWEQL